MEDESVIIEVFEGEMKNYPFAPFRLLGDFVPFQRLSK